jgi:hypothetical protein
LWLQGRRRKSWHLIFFALLPRSQSYDRDLQRQRCKFLQRQTQRCKTNPTIFLRCNYNAGIVNFYNASLQRKLDVSWRCKIPSVVAIQFLT